MKHQKIRKAKGETQLGNSPTTMSDIRNYLNDLPPDVAKRLYDFLHDSAGIDYTLNSEVPSDLPAYTPIDSSWLDGQQWVDHITCEQPTKGPFESSTGYNRFQLKFSGKRDVAGVFVSPTKSGSLAPLLRDTVFGTTDDVGRPKPYSGRDNDLWTRFKTLATPSFKAFFHHIAYLARRADDPTLPALPVDLGSGSAIAHLCDNKRCGKRPTHSLLLSSKTSICSVASVLS